MASNVSAVFSSSANHQDSYVAYTDGSCLKNPGVGGWAAIILKNNNIYKELSGSEEFTTNNRMEMRAALEVLRYVSQGSLVIHTDSEYLKNGITQWIKKWIVSNWMTSANKPVLNQDLWQEIARLNRNNIQWEWVKGHSGNIYNDMVDKIAHKAAQSLKNKMVS